jgi:Thiamine pyrophosphate-requiring enzymes [acetolactate synthase, pyruvate dehydrogenase (cytochrome), glyoxylate carboligase, phosphonopyruvate decarboxylase]
MAKGSDLLVSALEREGVDRIFAAPGEQSLDLVESLRTSTIEFVLTRHEQAAAFMAATEGRLTGRPGICLSTLGPGALNLAAGAAYAQLGAMPMLIITGQKPIKSARQASFQILDTLAAMRPLTKLTHQIASAESIPTLIHDAFRVATAERLGPVHLELPEDVASEKSDTALVPHQLINSPIAGTFAIERAAGLIAKAKCPIIMVGAAANRPHLVEPLSNFVRRTQIPFFNTPMGKGAVTGDSNCYLGTALLLKHDHIHVAIRRADLVLAIGYDAVEKLPFRMGSSAGGPRVIHIGNLPAHVEQGFCPNAEVVGDIGAGVLALADRLAGHIKIDTAMQALRKRILERINESSDCSDFPLKPQRIVRDVRAVMPDDGIVCLDNGMYKIWFARSYRTHMANTLLLDNAQATMGAGLPSAIAAKMLNPNRRVLAVCWDGSFLMNSQELETAVRLKVDLVVLIIEDRAFGMICWKQAISSFRELGMSFGNPDFVQYAKAYGAEGHRIGSAGQLVPTLDDAFGSGGVHVVVVPVDYRENINNPTDDSTSELAAPC